MLDADFATLIDKISAIIVVEHETQKGIIIGKNGEMLKRIGTYARQDAERMLGTKVNLKLWVKVKEGWRNREGIIKNFGLSSK